MTVNRCCLSSSDAQLDDLIYNCPYMRIAKPLLLVTTPVGVVWGIVEANRFHTWLAVLMIVLLTFISLCIGMTMRIIRRERRTQQLSTSSDAHDS